MATTTTIREARHPNGAVAATALRPLPNPPRDIDAMQQFSHTAEFLVTLKDRFAERPDFFVSGEGYLCLRRSQYRTFRVVPDCVVAFDVDPDAIYTTNGYVIDEVGKPPDFALEVGSESTGRKDYTVKRYFYARFGVKEYWRFDPTGGDHHDAPLAGDTLVGDAYAPIELREGAGGLLMGYSAVLGLDLHWEDGKLRLYDPVAQSYLMTFTESRVERLAAEARAEGAETALNEERAARLAAEAASSEERVARLAAEAVSSEERAARLAAEAVSSEDRAARLAAEDEARRLREDLDRLRSER